MHGVFKVNKGDKVTFDFSAEKRQIEGTVEKAFDKSVYIRVDFPYDKNKRIIRKRHQVQPA